MDDVMRIYIAGSVAVCLIYLVLGGVVTGLVARLEGRRKYTPEWSELVFWLPMLVWFVISYIPKWISEKITTRSK